MTKITLDLSPAQLAALETIALAVDWTWHEESEPHQTIRVMEITVDKITTAIEIARVKREDLI